MGSSMSALSCLKSVSNGEKITYDMAPVRSKNLPIVWLIGQQNTGKRTHGELMKENFNFEHINVTQLLRDEAAKETQRGKTIDDCLKNHKKISDFLIIELLKESMLNSNFGNGFVISNFPKNSKQADLFVKEISNVHFIYYFYSDTISLLRRAQEKSADEVNESLLKRHFAYATRDIKMSLGKFLPKVENVNTSGPPQEVFKNVEEIFKRRITMTSVPLRTIPETSSDPRSGDNTRESTERVPQSIIDTTQRVDPIINNHDLLKNELQNIESPPSELKLSPYGDNPQVNHAGEQDSDDVEMSNQSSDILFEDNASKCSSAQNNSIKEDSCELAPKIEKVPNLIEEDLADSLYS